MDDALISFYGMNKTFCASKAVNYVARTDVPNLIKSMANLVKSYRIGHFDLVYVHYFWYDSTKFETDTHLKFY